MFADGYQASVEAFSARIGLGESFDVTRKDLTVGEEALSVFFLDGMVKGVDFELLLRFFLARGKIGSADDAMNGLPAPEVRKISDYDAAYHALFSGECLLFASRFEKTALAVNFRSYPQRSVQEPESDRVMQGARDGFTETLLVNTALIRRRIRDPRLVFEKHTLGGCSRTDVVIAYMKGAANEKYVASVRKKVLSVKPKSVTLGEQSLAESLIRTGWWNPFPKIRTTERPDTAAAQLVEGDVLLLCDTSPQAMILPTSLFDYLQQTDDYYFPPFTGTYLRLVRTLILVMSVIFTPLWYLALQYGELLPPVLSFLVPNDPGALSILFQLFFAEIIIDGLKIASMNTPDLLSNSLSVVGALILGDFAVEVGWFCRDVILYMAFVAIANFAQQNHELGYAFKFMRMLLLGLTALLGLRGFVLGLLVIGVFIVTNKTIDGRHRYLYPLIPFNAKALSRLLFRTKKDDFGK